MQTDPTWLSSTCYDGHTIYSPPVPGIDTRRAQERQATEHRDAVRGYLSLKGLTYLPALPLEEAA